MNVSENYYSPRARGSRQEEEVNEDVASMVTVLADLTSNLLTFIDSISGKIPLIRCVSSRLQQRPGSPTNPTLTNASRPYLIRSSTSKKWPSKEALFITIKNLARMMRNTLGTLNSLYNVPFEAHYLTGLPAVLPFSSETESNRLSWSRISTL